MSEPLAPNEPNAQVLAETPKPESKPQRPFKVYKPCDSPPAPSPPPPDDYFNPTAADLKVAQAQLSARTQALVDAPLQLRATREASRETVQQAKKDRWPNTTIRVRFSDRTQLETVFPSTDKIKSVYAFVRELLREDMKPNKFILYQPPRRDLLVSDEKVRKLTLMDLQLTPASVLLLRFVDDEFNRPNTPAPLAPPVLAQAVELPVPPSNEQVEAATPASGFDKFLANTEKKVPKWLKGLTKK